MKISDNAKVRAKVNDQDSEFIRQKAPSQANLTMMKPKAEHLEPIIVGFRDKTIQDFLASQSKNTKQTCSTYFKRVLEFTNFVTQVQRLYLT